MDPIDHKTSPEISLVLSSGGLKPIASIALFDFLKEEKIPVDLLVGCSGGGIYAGMFSMGYSSSEMINITRKFLEGTGFSAIDYRTLLSIGKLAGGRFDLSKGLLKDEAPLEMCQNVFKDQYLETLPIKTILQATDIQLGKGVVLESGKLAEAVYASAAMYPLLPPIFMEGKWLADGAFTAPLPITEAVKRGADIIIAMIFNEKMASKPKKFIDSFYNMNRAYSQSLIRSQLSLAIDLHHYELIIINVNFEKYFSYSDPSNIEELVELGRMAVTERRDEILRAINNFNKIKK